MIVSGCVTVFHWRGYLRGCFFHRTNMILSIHMWSIEADIVFRKGDILGLGAKSEAKSNDSNLFYRKSFLDYNH